MNNENTKGQLAKKNINTNHRFLDEAGDLTFYKKRKVPAIGDEGVSKCFMIGMVKFKEPLEELRQKVLDLQKQVADNPYYDVPSVRKKKDKGGYFFHAKDDIPEIRKIMFDFINSIDCSFEAVVGRKSVEMFEKKHNASEKEFYADLLSHLIKNKLEKTEKLVLNIAQRGNTTQNKTLFAALEIAKERFAKTKTNRNFRNSTILTTKNVVLPTDIKTPIVFNVQNHLTEPLLNVADYFLWAVQRVFEKGETRYYNYIKDKVSVVIDLYDYSKFENWKNYYGPKNPLTEEVQIK